MSLLSPLVVVACLLRRPGAHATPEARRKPPGTRRRTLLLLQQAEANVIDDYARGYTEAMGDLGATVVGIELDDEE